MTVKRIGRRLLILLVTLAFIAGAGFWTFRNIGRWLVIQDPLQPARAIVVLSGRLPFRAMEAAQIYRQGWAPEVWVFEDEREEADAAFESLGIPHPTEQEYNRQVLERLGVPKSAIRVLEPPTTNTVSEAKRVAEELRRQGGDKAILVTSPVHTRRAKAIWRIVVGDHPQAILRYTQSEPSDFEHWWHSTHDLQDVEHEVLGLIDAYLGFPVKPRRE